MATKSKKKPPFPPKKGAKGKAPPFAKKGAKSKASAKGSGKGKMMNGQMDKSNC